MGVPGALDSPTPGAGNLCAFMKTLLAAALLVLALSACNRDRVESPEGATNDTVLTNTSVTDTASTNTETAALSTDATTGTTVTTTGATDTAATR